MDLRKELLRVLEIESRALTQCLDRFETLAPPLCKAVTLMNDSLEGGGKVVVTGVGKSGKVGEKIAATLTSTGSLAVFLHPTDALHGDLGVLTEKDVVLALSHTGNTEEIVRLLPSIKRRGTPLLSICGKLDSRLAKESTVWIDSFVEAEACPHNLAPTSSTTLALALGDALAMALMSYRKFDPSRFAQNHPAGSLGQRLTLLVTDLMKKGPEVGVVSPDAPIAEVVALLTQKSWGGVLVVGAGDALLGIITDGDLRRALTDQNGFFSRKASDIMTASPVTVFSDQLAFEALELMENRNRQINVLPVLNRSTGKKWEGLLRLHDLVAIF